MPNLKDVLRGEVGWRAAFEPARASRSADRPEQQDLPGASHDHAGRVPDERSPLRGLRRAGVLRDRVWRQGRPSWEAAAVLLALYLLAVPTASLLQRTTSGDTATLIVLVACWAVTVLVLARLRGAAGWTTWTVLLAAALLPPAVAGDTATLDGRVDAVLALLVVPATVLRLLPRQRSRRRVLAGGGDRMLGPIGFLLVLVGLATLGRMSRVQIGLVEVGLDGRWVCAALFLLGVYCLRHLSRGVDSDRCAYCGAPDRGFLLCTSCKRKRRMIVTRATRRDWASF